ncbi:MAG: glycosyltransferase family 4 protein [Magnetococcus sp. WYHC-3]
MTAAAAVSPALTLFFTTGQSLTRWQELGMLTRELALYRRLAEHVARVTLVTYGDARDRDYQGAWNGIDVVCNRWSLPGAGYRHWLTRWPQSWQRRPGVFKSNQFDGSLLGLDLARRFGHPFVARGGYPFAAFIARRHGADSPQARRARLMEFHMVSRAEQVVVTTPEMAMALRRDHGVAGERIQVIPNHVDTDHWSPRGVGDRPHGTRLVHVGRLTPQKNLPTLLQALERLPGTPELWIIGSGPDAQGLKQQAAPLGERVRFLGNCPHDMLPQVLGQCDIFVLPSHYEGHPKALLEAMSMGLAVVGSRAPGIDGVIRDGENGRLFHGGAAGLAAVLASLLASPQQRQSLGQAARAHVERHFSLQRVLNQELALIHALHRRRG